MRRAWIGPGLIVFFNIVLLLILWITGNLEEFLKELWLFRSLFLSLIVFVVVIVTGVTLLIYNIPYLQRRLKQKPEE